MTEFLEQWRPLLADYMFIEYKQCTLLSSVLRVLSITAFEHVNRRLE